VTFPARLLLCIGLVCTPALSAAQGPSVAFGQTQQTGDLPVEVTADNLDVDQSAGTAVFTGNVVVGRGDMRLSASRVLVVYHEGQSRIERLKASGGVTLVSGEDAAEAQRADYNLDTGVIDMQGDVLVVQGPQAVTADSVVVDLRAGTARMRGRVKTVLQPEAQN
jgi:lipopolysaccharide export system protein LptA